MLNDWSHKVRAILKEYCPGNIKNLLPSLSQSGNTRFYFGHQKLCMDNNIKYCISPHQNVSSRYDEQFRGAKHQLYKLLKKVWNITSALNFCTFSFFIFTWVLHVLKDCSFPYILQKKNHENRSGESRITACQMLGGGCRNSFSCTLNCIDVKKV